MGRESLVPKTIVRADGKTSTYWVRPDHKAKVGMGIAAAIMIPVSAMALSGCATGAGNDTTPSPLDPSGSTTPETPRSSETAAPVAIAGDTNNDGKLSAFEKQILDSHAAKEYPMPDGSVVKIDPTQPFSAPVLEVVQANAAPFSRKVAESEHEAESYAILELRAQVDAEAASTGKNIVYIFQMQGLADPNSRDTVTFWSTMPSGLRSTGVENSQDQATVIAGAQAWASSRGYEVVILG